MGVRGDKVFKKRMDDARFVNVASQCGYTEFYIFNNEDGKGFIIIAADDCVMPILGYSYDNNFVSENLPPNLKGWLDNYAEQIQLAVELRATATEEIRTNWDCLRRGKNLPIKSENAVSELLSTTWNQNYPYCYYCPYNSFYSQYTPTGCVATATAQIMKYYEYPTHGYGYNEYYCFPYGTQSANFGNTSYDWINMLDDYSGSYNSTQRNAIAKLMYHCGVSVNMDYGVDGSNAYIITNDYGGYREHCAENAFERYFGYSSSIQGLKRDYESNWINILKNELNNNRPILYGGRGTGGGHAFVCDGYDNNNYFHFNWGWGGDGQGSNNNYGYFILDYLCPIDQFNNIHNYSSQQVALIGIQPDSNLQSYNLVLCHDVEMLDDWGFGNFAFGQEISMYTEILNQGNSPFSGYIAAAVFDNDGYFIDFLGGGSTYIQPYYYVHDTTTHEGGVPFLPSFDYLYHTVMFYSTNGENWTIINGGNYSNDGVFQVLNNGEDIETNSPMTFSNGEESVLFNGQDRTINVEVLNQGDYTYNNYIWLALLDSEENYVQIIDDLLVNIPVNGSVSLNYTDIITAPEGQYYLALLYSDPEGYTRYVGSVFYPSIKRVYVIGSHNINATANPNNGGIVTGGGNYLEGETCTLTATANTGYTFVNWTENGTQVSTNANYTFTVTEDRTLLANFLSPTYIVNTSANPNNGGTVSTEGDLTYNFENGFSGWTSIDADGDGFNWITGNEIMGTGYGHNGSNDLLLSQSYINNYGALYPDNYLVSPQVALGGSISFWACAQDNAYASEHFGVAVSTTSNTNANSFTTIQEWTMTAKGEGQFSNHSRDGNSRDQGNWYQYTVDLSAFSGQTGYIAIRHFNCSDMFYLDVDDVAIHTVGGNTYYQGQLCTVHATANSGFIFVNWTENGTQVSTNPNYTFTVTGNRNLVANFQQQQQQYTISVSASPSNGGNVTGGGTYNQGQSCTVSATANSGYTFVNWTENGTQVSTNANYTFTVTGNRNLVAHFTAQSYVITAIADPTAGGVVTGSGGYNYGETCTLTATPNTGYSFQRWTKNGSQVSTNPTYSFTVTESATYTAHFNAQSYTITVAANPNNAGSVSGGGSYTYGQTCTVSASANSSYTFTNWTENGNQVSTNTNYSFTVTGNRNLVANFTQNAHTIHASAGANGIITPSGTVTVAHGANQTFSMIPDSDYEVQEVYIDGNPVGAMTSYTFTNVTADHYIHVTFSHVDAVGENNSNSINVYPNPTKGEVILEGEGLSHVRIVNAFGQTVYNTKVEDDQVRIDLSGMAKGIYMMHIEAENGQTVKKIVVE